MGQADVVGLGEGLPRLRRGLRVTHLGDERLVLDPASGVVHTVRGPAVRVLDAVITGSAECDREIIAALSEAGIMEWHGVSRRQVLALSTSAATLVSSVFLPSAFAAASTVSLTASGGSGSVIEYSLTDGRSLYRLVNLTSAESDTNYALTTTASTIVDVLLVGGGGSGGDIGDAASAEFFGGGGGGGEVALISLGTVAASTTLNFTVAGFSSGVGRDSVLTVGSDSVTAKGGGRGAARVGSTVTAASAGGSGGGASPSSTAGGTTASGAVVGSLTRTSSRVNSGGGSAGDDRAGGGGGGASAGGVPSDGNNGGNGGGGISLATATNWNLTVGPGDPNPTAVQSIFGSGGGGAAAGISGTSDAGGFGGYGGDLDRGAARAGVGGPLGSGAGGGGGIRISVGDGAYSPAGSGQGGSGVVWVRTRAA